MSPSDSAHPIHACSGEQPKSGGRSQDHHAYPSSTPCLLCSLLRPPWQSILRITYTGNPNRNRRHPIPACIISVNPDRPDVPTYLPRGTVSVIHRYHRVRTKAKSQQALGETFWDVVGNAYAAGWVLTSFEGSDLLLGFTMILDNVKSNVNK
ncbi:hypothetical protein BO71DRAFT_413563 [Aspergillus ellipticus CBS 707.79]|uniref:Uncharacterized protein n=1 Tax=Aspergillus ellipticus CBS 707.79 TaxID=1448320 RepID=A0A319CV67_9EURO|nr:hypothetical protein BO71DRAFT_413563 [Aspergillus ellipticus CBS 707.79]